MPQQGSEEKKSDISLHLDQQAPQFKAAIEAISDSYQNRLDALREYKIFFEGIYTGYSVQDYTRDIENGNRQYYGERLRKARLAITGYLKGIGLGSSIDLKDIPDEEAVIQIRGIFDNWYVKEVASLQKSLKEDLDKLIDRMKA
ncbi:MAG: hypothetical protein PHW01_05045 [Patescibacteria group bacterium]|nr:hypothetical protein [Patescibacteria group bacterium]